MNVPLADRLKTPVDRSPPLATEVRRLSICLTLWAVGALLAATNLIVAGLRGVPMMQPPHGSVFTVLLLAHAMLGISLVPLVAAVLRRLGVPALLIIIAAIATYIGCVYVIGIVIPVGVYIAGQRRVEQEAAG